MNGNESTGISYLLGMNVSPSTHPLTTLWFLLNTEMQD